MNNSSKTAAKPPPPPHAAPHDATKDAPKTRMHTRQANCKHKRDNTDTKCPLCQKSEDTTEHALECEKAKKFTLSKENSKEEWEEITEITVDIYTLPLLSLALTF